MNEECTRATKRKKPRHADAREMTWKAAPDRKRSTDTGFPKKTKPRRKSDNEIGCAFSSPWTLSSRSWCHGWRWLRGVCMQRPDIILGCLVANSRACPAGEAVVPVAAYQGYPLGLATLTVDPAGTVSNKSIESLMGSTSGASCQGPPMGGLSAGRPTGDDADTLERRELATLPGDVIDEAPDELDVPSPDEEELFP
ncbi:hypothetical protein AG1IA_01247 [Rhizoctonia solani AG-1 IA]|uniref:Uncharacterized protein n=1 Tax=Thanatephorus cucumeris (strain AG1-IA) TaxID=983506 RepID=L8X6J8_THACA|nr:hypothetical protein AG1IA_01247 [Rhizoctonia solani AG-1 IA]